MTSYDILVSFLIALNALQFYFWSRNTQRLIDKVMSRDYHSYALSEASSKIPPGPLVHRAQMPPDDIEDMNVLNNIGL